APTTGGTQTSYPPSTPSTNAPLKPDSAAHISIQVPADAEVRIDGALVGTGAVREYETTPLKSGFTYTYVIRARWEQDGNTITQTRNVDVAAGGRVTVRFPLEAGNGG